ncbi:putative Mn2+ efflux pump MntP [Ochrobactrum sp. P6BSIII]|uniref:manganese efflux pump MntP n=1 Tax=unclassified Ochrobactrum TaxID=239106 RepID=UPI0017E96FBC|nr:putative Mn2+ efflux pump MntP [Ochrobactrum sp. P6BSIII]
MMSPITVFFLSVSMSVDAFAVSVGRGTALNRRRLSEALRTGIVFGVVEAITPFLGWVAGVLASDWVSQIDHWLAFGLLSAVGLHMLYTVIWPKDDDADETPQGGSFLVLLATAVGTSIDAMAVGLSLAFLGIGLQGIIAISLAIGFATFIMSTMGLMIGKAIGAKFGKFAEVAAAVVLCALGTSILFEHLSA